MELWSESTMLDIGELCSLAVAGGGSLGGLRAVGLDDIDLSDETLVNVGARSLQQRGAVIVDDGGVTVEPAFTAIAAGLQNHPTFVLLRTSDRVESTWLFPALPGTCVSVQMVGPLVYRSTVVESSVQQLASRLVETFLAEDEPRIATLGEFDGSEALSRLAMRTMPDGSLLAHTGPTDPGTRLEKDDVDVAVSRCIGAGPTAPGSGTR